MKDHALALLPPTTPRRLLLLHHHCHQRRRNQAMYAHYYKKYFRRWLKWVLGGGFCTHLQVGASVRAQFRRLMGVRLR